MRGWGGGEFHTKNFGWGLIRGEGLFEDGGLFEDLTVRKNYSLFDTY